MSNLSCLPFACLLVAGVLMIRLITLLIFSNSMSQSQAQKSTTSRLNPWQEAKQETHENVNMENGGGFRIGLNVIYDCVLVCLSLPASGTHPTLLHALL